MTYYTLTIDGATISFSTKRKLDIWRRKNPGHAEPEQSHEISEETVRELRKIANKRKAPDRLTMAKIYEAIKAAGLKSLKPDAEGNLVLKILK